MHGHTCIHTRTEEVPLRLNLIIITLGSLRCFNYSHYSQHHVHFLSCWQYLGSSSCSLTFTLIATVLPCKGILNITVKHKSSRQLLFPAIQILSLSFSWALQSTFRLAPLLKLFQNVWLWFDSSFLLNPSTSLLPLLVSSSPGFLQSISRWPTSSRPTLCDFGHELHVVFKDSGKIPALHLSSLFLKWHDYKCIPSSEGFQGNWLVH